MVETANYRTKLLSLTRQLLKEAKDVLEPGDTSKVKALLEKAVNEGVINTDRHGINPLLHDLETALTLCQMVSADRNMIAATLLYRLASPEGIWPYHDINTDVAKLISGLTKVSNLYGKQAVVKTDNFRRLLMTFADDIRVIIIMIVDRLVLMRNINHHPDEKFVTDTAFEANYLYAPLAHRLGLYKIKGELEDLALKYTRRDEYTAIARELNATKTARDAYIQSFITPVRQRLDQTGLNYEIKGRTKSIFSIWNKMRKQHNEMKDIYDLFAIRIILDTPLQREKADCWNVYSVIADMYTPNPARMKDWLSIPKSNGYESLHTTVKGPEGKWVEVQIRTRRMDLVAEKGLAAHWKYKGIKSESDLDSWMNNIRDILESADGPLELMRNFKMDLYDKEVFIFTPKGDLYRLPLGATVLDFAFHIHSSLGCSCTGGKVNGRTRRINYKLQSGDTVEIMTSSNQVPKQDWLNFVTTSKARNKIRQTIKEMENRAAALGKELLQRRLKNRKIETSESILMKAIKRLGYKTVTDFYRAISDGPLSVDSVIAQCEAITMAENSANESERHSAEDFTLQPDTTTDDKTNADVLVIGQGIKGINYKLAKCCNPIQGDNVFGFISSEGVIKVHRTDCPNAANIRSRYPYRLIRTRWSGKIGSQFISTLRVVGHDDIGIVTNITSIITKERDVSLRNISIESHDGLFSGHLVIGVENTASLENIIRKIKTVKGVKDVTRSN